MGIPGWRIAIGLNAVQPGRLQEDKVQGGPSEPPCFSLVPDSGPGTKAPPVGSGVDSKVISVRFSKGSA